MDQSRYRDKAYLVTYELTTDIFDMYDVKVDDIVPIRSVYMIYTDKGVKILKKVNYSREELEFINFVVKHASNNGYRNIVSFMNTTDGNYYVKKDDGIYVMLNLSEGRDADFRNPIDIALIAKALCNFHKSTQGMRSILDSRNNLHKWIPSFKKRMTDLLKFKEISGMHEIKSTFDNIYLEYVDRYLNDAKESIDLLEASEYEALCCNADYNGTICHHDLAYHNILIDNDNNVYLVDFDYCIMDLRIHDIANLMVKSIKNSNWDIEKGVLILHNYCKVDSLSIDELKVLYAFLKFPQDFYEISRQYYMKTKNWDEEDFLARLERKAGYYSDRKLFLEGLKEFIERA